mmetsp:Transcript_14184/g.19702  ORF Transcript_14184/g.19702 Transcript_14184/m.19702 type:complete len:209 (+) Transcript_14184:720-1346(+)
MNFENSKNEIPATDIDENTSGRDSTTSLQRFYNMNFEKNDEPLERKEEPLASTSDEADEGGRGSVASKDTTTSAERFYEMNFDPVAPETKVKATAATVMSEEIIDDEEQQHDDGASQGSANLDETERNEHKEEHDRGSIASRDTTTSAQRFYEMSFEPAAPETKEETKTSASEATEEHDNPEIKEVEEDAAEDAEQEQEGVKEDEGRS